MLHFVIANRYEFLKAVYLQTAGGASQPLVDKTLIIPSVAITRDLQLAFTAQNGVCMGIDFCYLGDWVTRTVSQALPNVAQIDRATLPWYLFQLFTGEAHRLAAGSHLQHYLQHIDDLGKYTFACHCADIFIRYMIYRPDWLLTWQKGEMPRTMSTSTVLFWQADLWRQLLKLMGIARWQSPVMALIAQLRLLSATNSATPKLNTNILSCLPQQIDLFCVQQMAPIYGQLITALAEVTEVNAYCINPCQEFWEGVKDRKQYWQQQMSQGDISPDQLANQLADPGEIGPGTAQRTPDVQAPEYIEAIDYADELVTADIDEADIGDADAKDFELVAALAHKQSEATVPKEMHDLWAEMDDIFAEQDESLLTEEAYQSEHPLLAAWGKSAKIFWQQWSTTVASDEYTLFLPYDHRLPRFFPTAKAVDSLSEAQAPAASTLHRLQNSILNLSLVELRQPPVLADGSIQFHDCHTLQRQVAVCHEQLRLLLSRPDAPPLDQIVVLTPNLAAVAPMVRSIWGMAGNIPFEISGLISAEDQLLAETFKRVCQVISDDFSVVAVMDLLHLPLVAQKFGLSTDDLQQLEQLLSTTGVTGGWDNEGDFGWNAALSRLFLGFALPVPEEDVIGAFAGLTPVYGFGGKAVSVLDTFWQFIDRCQQLHRRIQPNPSTTTTTTTATTTATSNSEQPLSIDLCRSICLSIVQYFIDVPQSGRAAQTRLTNKLSDLCDVMATTVNSIHWPVFRTAIEQALQLAPKGGVAAGKVTITSIHALRYMSFAVIAVIGCEQDEFPRHAVRSELDQTLQRPRLGDENVRDDDKTLFLELLCAARQQFWLFYNGRNFRDNSPRPAAAVISELTDFLGNYLDPATMTTFHPLNPDRTRQPTAIVNSSETPANPTVVAIATNTANTANSTNPTNSTSEANNSAVADKSAAVDNAVVSNNSATSDNSPADNAVTDQASENKLSRGEHIELSLDDIARFYFNAAALWLRQKLGMMDWDEWQELPTLSPVALAEYGELRLMERLFPWARNPEITAACLSALAAAGQELPEGLIRESDWGERSSQITMLQQFAAKINQATTPKISVPAQHIQHSIGVDTITLHLPALTISGSGLIDYQLADKLNARNLWHCWLQHVTVNHFADTIQWTQRRTSKLFRPISGNGEGDGYFNAKESCYIFHPLARQQAGNLILQWLDDYYQGLHQLRAVPFRTSWIFVNNGVDKARETWAPVYDAQPGESAKPAWQLVHQEKINIFDADFAESARQMWQPLLHSLGFEA